MFHPDRKPLLRQICLAVLLGSAGLVSTAYGATTIWTGNTSSDPNWFTGTNWSVGVAPTSAADVVLNAGSSVAAPILFHVNHRKFGIWHIYHGREHGR